MKFIFLGTGSSYPSVQRGVSSMALQLDNGSVWIFDCGEGTQIQLQKVSLSRNKINRIFITHLHGDHLFGLPGLLCTISSQCGLCNSNDDQTESSNSSVPVIDIIGPFGLRKFLYTALSLSRSPLVIKFKVHEMEPIEDQYPEDWNIWSVDHSTSLVFHPSEIPGSLIKPNRYDNGNISWKIFNDEFCSIEAGMIHHRIPSFGFVIKEKDRPGTLLVDKLKAAGVAPGPFYGKLKSGVSLTLEDGRIIHPTDFLGPTIKGRTIVICGDTNDASPMQHLIKECDVLVHESTHDDSLISKAEEFGHSTPAGATLFSKRIRAKVLLLNHFSQRYADATKDRNKEETVELILNQAKKGLEGTDTDVFCAHDLFVYELQRTQRRSTEI